MSNLPMDLIADVLSRLSVKNLLCFRCVSTTFRSLIDSSEFVHHHLNHSAASHSKHMVLLKNSDLRFSDLDSLDSFVDLETPLMNYRHGIKVLGSCHGLICVCNIIDDTVMWNPSTREYIVLPTYSVGTSRVYVFGFGYDYVNDDYKVVRIKQSGGVDGKRLESEVNIWSIGLKGWRRIEDVPYVFSYPGVIGAFAGGALHWVVSREDEPGIEKTIVALDLGVEEYREVPQPVYDDGRFKLNVAVLGGCLSVVANYAESHVDVWVMREYGVKESWIKLFSLYCKEMRGCLRFVKPLAYSRSGGKVLLERDNSYLFWYDLKSKKTEEVGAKGIPFSFESQICLQSLVSLNVLKRNAARRQRMEEEKKKNDFLSVGFKLVL